MNTLKPLLIVAVLAGIGYGVYVRINSGNDAPPPGVAEGWDAAPKVELHDNNAPGTVAGWGPGGGPSIAGGIAPAFGGTRSAPPPAGGEAAPYPPGQASANIAASGGIGATLPSRGEIDHRTPSAAATQPPDVQANSPYANAPRVDGAPPRGANPQDFGVAPPAGAENRAADRYGAGPAFGGDAANASGFGAVMQAAQRELEAGQMASALQQLSIWYDDPRLSPGDQQQLTQVLDQVAGTVVYSTQHLLEPPYEVQAGERLEDIGERFNVPWQLLAKINGIEDPQSLRPGERLKVVRGPFSAVVNLDKRQLTLFLNGAYAGRFAIGIGVERPPQEGSYAVSDKVMDPVYHGRDRAMGADDPNNPYGERWIGLGAEFGIHGTNRPDNIGRTDLAGSISLNPRDVEDVYDILSVGSKVIIRR